MSGIFYDAFSMMFAVFVHFIVSTQAQQYIHIYIYICSHCSVMQEAVLKSQVYIK